MNHGHSHGGKPCGGHGHSHGGDGGHGHSHGGDGGHGHSHGGDGGHGHSHGGKPCGGHGHGGPPQMPDPKDVPLDNILDYMQNRLPAERTGLRNNKGERLDNSAVEGHVLGLVFGAFKLNDWAQTVETLEKHAAEISARVNSEEGAGLPAFKFVYCGADSVPEDSAKAIASLPDGWLALPFGDPRMPLLARLLRIPGLPSICLYGADGDYLSSQGLAVLVEQGVAKYPWRELSGSGPGPEGIHELSVSNNQVWQSKPCLVVLWEDPPADEEEIPEEEEARKEVRGRLEQALVELRAQELKQAEAAQSAAGGAEDDEKEAEPFTPLEVFYAWRSTLASRSIRSMLGLNPQPPSQQFETEEEAMAWQTQAMSLAGPQLFVLDLANDYSKYVFEKPDDQPFAITPEQLQTFVAAYHRGDLQPYVTSEPEPENDRDPELIEEVPVGRVVGSSFKRLIVDNTEDVILLNILFEESEASFHLMDHFHSAALAVSKVVGAEAPIKWFDIALDKNEVHVKYLGGGSPLPPLILMYPNPKDRTQVVAFRNRDPEEGPEAPEQGMNARVILRFLAQHSGLGEDAVPLKDLEVALAAERWEEFSEQQGEWEELFKLVKEGLAADPALAGLSGSLNSTQLLRGVLGFLNLVGPVPEALEQVLGQQAEGPRVPEVATTAQEWNKLWLAAIRVLDVDPSHLLRSARYVLGVPACKALNRCTFAATGEDMVPQLEVFNCLTCFPDSDEVAVCGMCARVCHDGHELEPSTSAAATSRGVDMFCDCGEGTAFPQKCRCL